VRSKGLLKTHPPKAIGAYFGYFVIDYCTVRTHTVGTVSMIGT
jgi:hypothetical protein